MAECSEDVDATFTSTFIVREGDADRLDRGRPGAFTRVMTLRALCVLTWLVLLTPAVASAQVVTTVRAAGRTTGHAARDGTRTVGRTVRAFFHGGTSEARQTARDNAAITRRDARQNAAATRRAGRRAR